MSVLSDGYERTIIKTKTQGYVLIDTRYTFDVGYETIVVRCNADEHVKKGDWDNCLELKNYGTMEQASKSHADVVNVWMNK